MFSNSHIRITPSLKTSSRVNMPAIIALLCWLCLSATGAHAATSPSILVLGDSISAAYGIDPSHGWVHLFQQRLHQQGYDYTVVNGSVSGSTTGDGLARLPALLKQYQPKLVIVELGGNDGLRGYPLNIMRGNLQKIIALAHNSNAQVLIAGIEIPPNYGRRYTEQFRQIFSAVASDKSVALLPFILDAVARQPKLMQGDGIHPTAKAQPLIVDTVWPHIQPLLAKSSLPAF